MVVAIRKAFSIQLCRMNLSVRYCERTQKKTFSMSPGGLRNFLMFWCKDLNRILSLSQRFSFILDTVSSINRYITVCTSGQTVTLQIFCWQNFVLDGLGRQPAQDRGSVHERGRQTHHPQGDRQWWLAQRAHCGLHGKTHCLDWCQVAFAPEWHT